MKFRRKILGFFWCSTWLRSVIVNRSESEENCWVKRGIPRIMFLEICLSMLWEKYWKTMRNFSWFPVQSVFQFSPNFVGKILKNIGGITQCLFSLFAIISVRFFEKRMVKLEWDSEEKYSDFCRYSIWAKERIIASFLVFSLKIEEMRVRKKKPEPFNLTCSLQGSKRLRSFETQFFREALKKCKK